MTDFMIAMRHQPIATGDHVGRDVGVAPFVGIPQAAAAQEGEGQHDGDQRHDPLRARRHRGDDGRLHIAGVEAVERCGRAHGARLRRRSGGLSQPNLSRPLIRTPTHALNNGFIAGCLPSRAFAGGQFAR